MIVRDASRFSFTVMFDGFPSSISTACALNCSMKPRKEYRHDKPTPSNKILERLS